jgi:deoxyribonuclease-4
MLYIGCHLSATKGYFHMGKTAKEIGANTFQFFTRNPRGGKAKELDFNDIAKYLSFAEENGFGKIVAHAPYTVNPCSADNRTRDFAHMIIKDDMERMNHLPGNYYNLHPGSHTGQGIEQGISLTADLINDILKPDHKTTLLIETMSGKGSEIGSNFEEIHMLISKIKLNDKVGVCLDTCHVNDGGYDIVNNLESVLGKFDEIIGFDKLYALHINDSKNPFEAHKDRHAKLGEGHIGTEAIMNVVNHPKLKDKLFILETPNELDGYQKEIETIKKLAAK